MVSVWDLGSLLTSCGRVFMIFERTCCCVSIVWSFRCCGRLLLGSCCSSSAGLWSSESILCACGSRGPGTQCCCGLYTACWCHSRVPGREVPTVLWHNTEAVLSCSCCGSICRAVHYVHGSTCGTGLSDTYVIFLTWRVAF